MTVVGRPSVWGAHKGGTPIAIKEPNAMPDDTTNHCPVCEANAPIVTAAREWVGASTEWESHSKEAEERLVKAETALLDAVDAADAPTGGDDDEATK